MILPSEPREQSHLFRWVKCLEPSKRWRGAQLAPGDTHHIEGSQKIPGSARLSQEKLCRGQFKNSSPENSSFWTLKSS